MPWPSSSLTKTLISPCFLCICVCACQHEAPHRATLPCHRLVCSGSSPSRRPLVNLNVRTKQRERTSEKSHHVLVPGWTKEAATDLRDSIATCSAERAWSCCFLFYLNVIHSKRCGNSAAAFRDKRRKIRRLHTFWPRDERCLVTGIILHIFPVFLFVFSLVPFSFKKLQIIAISEEELWDSFPSLVFSARLAASNTGDISMLEGNLIVSLQSHLTPWRRWVL